jgi:regulator of replication initiation timing
MLLKGKHKMFPQIKVNWQERHDQLAKLTAKLVEHIRETEGLQQRIHYFLNESDRLALREKGQRRYLRLKKTLIVPTVYANREENKEYPEGTLIDAEIRGNCAHVYIDDEGDGNIYFPAEELEEVLVSDDDDTVDWNNMVCQG